MAAGCGSTAPFVTPPQSEIAAPASLSLFLSLCSAQWAHRRASTGVDAQAARLKRAMLFPGAVRRVSLSAQPGCPAEPVCGFEMPQAAEPRWIPTVWAAASLPEDEVLPGLLRLVSGLAFSDTGHGQSPDAGIQGWRHL